MRRIMFQFGVVLAMAGCAGPVLLGTFSSAYAQAVPSEEKQAFEDAKDLGTVEAWDAFLANYPSGFHADLARAYLKKLADAPSTKSPAASQADAPANAASPGNDYPMVAGTWGGIVRSGAGQGYDKVASLKEGEEVVLMGPGVDVQQGDYPWFKIAYGDGEQKGYMWGGILCSTGSERPDLYKLCTFTPVRQPSRAAAQSDAGSDHGPTPMQSCRDAGMDYNGSECVARRSSKPSKATVERRAKASCVELGMIYRNGQCAPKKKSERNRAARNKNKACPAGMYRNPYGQCQPNETGG